MNSLSLIGDGLVRMNSLSLIGDGLVLYAMGSALSNDFSNSSLSLIGNGLLVLYAIGSALSKDFPNSSLSLIGNGLVLYAMGSPSSNDFPNSCLPTNMRGLGVGLAGAGIASLNDFSLPSVLTVTVIIIFLP